MQRIRSFKLILFVFAWLTFGAACGSTSSGPGPVFLDTNNSDTTQILDTTTRIGELSFVAPVGDNGQACGNQCTFIMSYGEARPLQVRYMADNQPIANELLTYQIIDPLSGNPAPAGAQYVVLPSSQTPTDNTGVGSMTAQAQSLVGQVRVRVTVTSAPQVQPLYFDIAVSPKNLTPLSLSLSYPGLRNIEAVDVYLYRQTPQAPNPCANVDPTSPGPPLGTADQFVSESKPLPYSVNFKNFPNLETDSPQYYTIIVLGHELNSTTNFAWVCEDGLTNKDLVKVQYGLSNVLPMVLEDVPPTLVGIYDVNNYFDMISGLPPSVEGPVNAVLNLFESPVGGILQLTCAIGGDALDGICAQLFVDPANPCVEPGCLKGLGEVLVPILDQFVWAAIENNLGATIFQVGQDVRMLLTDLNLESTIEFFAEPDGNGLILEGTNSEIWHGFRYRWTFGQDCPLNDETCGWNYISMEALPGMSSGVLSSTFTGSVTESESATGVVTQYLNVDEHSVNLKYGLLLNFIFEKIVIPAVMNDPNVDTWTEFLQTLLGGQGCIQTANCCENLASGIDPTFQGVATSLCENLTTLGGVYITAQLMGLDAESGESFTLETKDPCPIYDTDQDIKIDSLGKEGDVCTWNANLSVGGTDVLFDIDFFGLRQE
jgi:hypothetical protein